MRGVPGSAPQRHTTAANGKKNRRKLRAWVAEELRISTFIVIVGGALILAALALWFWSGSSYGQSSYVNTKEYQAVFLTNGQVYFGKVTSLNHDYMVLNDIYYLQSSSNSTSNPQPSTKNNDLTLVKLGLNELHAPEDRMVISQSQVSFWENMKDSSKVVSAIKQYQANPNSSTNQVQNSAGSSSSGGRAQ